MLERRSPDFDRGRGSACQVTLGRPGPSGVCPLGDQKNPNAAGHRSGRSDIHGPPFLASASPCPWPAGDSLPRFRDRPDFIDKIFARRRQLWWQLGRATTPLVLSTGIEQHGAPIPPVHRIRSGHPKASCQSTARRRAWTPWPCF